MNKIKITLLLLTISLSAFASKIPPLNYKTLNEKSAIILIGKVEDVKKIKKVGGSSVAYNVRVMKLSTIKGKMIGKRLSIPIRSDGAKKLYLMMIQKGKKYMFFINPEQRLGFYDLVHIGRIEKYASHIKASEPKPTNINYNPQQTRTDFEKMAIQLPYLSVKSVLYNRASHHFQVADPKKREEHFRILAKVANRKYSKEALLKLLAHDNPKVRTLAAVALFSREDPTVLPSLVRLYNDKSITFDGHPQISADWLKDTGIGPPAKKQTVEDIARKMVAFYLRHSGFYHFYNGPKNFSVYWEARKNRSHCAGWFAVQLSRASQGTRPTQKYCIESIKAVRKRINELPSDESTWVLLWLNGEDGGDVLVTEKELVEACKEIGADKLLLMLQNKIPSDDPDLQPRKSNNWSYKRMQLFVLRHADQLLRPSDSEKLLACERWQRNYRKHGIGDPTISPWWAIAAARLSPKRASKILHAAIRRFQGKHDSDKRSNLCVALWQLLGNSEIDFLVDWFYKENLKRGHFPNCRSSFLRAVGKETKGIEIISKIVKDSRFSYIDWQSLQQLVRVVNTWLKSPIVSDAELRKAWHPFGMGHYDSSQDKAKEKYPKETKNLQAHLNEWRKRLRISMPKLLNKYSPNEDF